MIQPLRTYHRRAFLALAVVLPIVFGAGLVVRPKPAGGNPVVRAVLVAGGNLQDHSFAVQISSAANGGRIARLFPTKALSTPDLLVYLADGAPRQGSLPAGARLLGEYDFDASYAVPASGLLVLYSPAHNSVLDSLSIGDFQ